MYLLFETLMPKFFIGTNQTITRQTSVSQISTEFDVARPASPTELLRGRFKLLSMKF